MARKLIDLTGATITFREDKLTYERVVQFLTDTGKYDAWEVDYWLPIKAYTTESLDVLIDGIYFSLDFDGYPICETMGSPNIIGVNYFTVFEFPGGELDLKHNSFYNIQPSNENDSVVRDPIFLSFIQDTCDIEGGTWEGEDEEVGQGIRIGGESIKVVRCGSDLVKEVYSGSDLIWRAFHNFIEGYSTYALPPQGNGSKLILPAYTGQNPPGEYFECYIYTEDGSEYYPGDEFIYPDDPEIAEDWDIGFDNQETPYYYPHHFMAQYSSNPSTDEPEQGETCYGEVRVSGFDVNIAGNRVGIGNSMTFTGDYQQSFNYTINNIFQFGGFTNNTTGLSYVGVVSLDAVQAYNIPSWRPNATNGAASAPSTVSVTQSRTITLNSSYVIQEWFCLYQYNGKYYV